MKAVTSSEAAPKVRAIALPDDVTGALLFPDLRLGILDAGRGLAVVLDASSARALAAELNRQAGPPKENTN